MRDIVIAAGIQDQEYDAAIKGLEDQTSEQIRETFDWLQTLKSTAYREVWLIWILKEPQWWANLSMFGFSNTREQKLLRKARKTLRTAWRARYAEPKPEEAASQAVTNPAEASSS